MKIAIRGHELRGKEVIQILESLGGINRMHHSGRFIDYFYYISSDDDTIAWTCIRPECNVYTLEEFETEFPFKIGDKVITTLGHTGTIINIRNNKYEVFFKTDSALISSKRLKPYKEMEKRNISITLDKAKEWYQKGGELKEVALQAYSEEELTKIELPKTWEEFCDNYTIDDNEAHFDSCCTIHSAAITNRHSLYDRNICPSKESAKAHLAIIQLEQLRDCWRQGWEPIWDYSEKWCIRLWGNELSVGITKNISRFLTFPTKEMAEEFLKCFKDLIEQAGDLI